jgi:perosamine synthetase
VAAPAPQVSIRRYERRMEAYERLEYEWADFNELPPEGMVACSSGSAALHLALEALELPPGAEVLVPDYTMIACPRAVTLAGLTPVFVDCDDTLNIDADLAGKGITDNTAAILAVHVYGRRCRVQALHQTALPDKYRGPPVIEDMAEAHGVKPHDWTDAACWSFQSSKVVHGEEGGAVYFKDPGRAKLARSLRTLGFTDDWDFTHIPRGWNYRLSNLHAQAISQSVIAYGNNVYRRRRLEEAYDALCPPEWRMPPRDCPWIWDLRIPGMTADRQNAVVNALRGAGIAARHSFKPMHTQQEYVGSRLVTSPAGSKALVASREVIYLPLHPDRTSDGTPERAFRLIHDSLLTHD